MVKVKVKGDVIRVLSWILGMSYSVIDGLVQLSLVYSINIPASKYRASLFYLSVVLGVAYTFTVYIIVWPIQVQVKTRSSAIAGRPCDAKACQGLLKWTWK